MQNNTSSGDQNAGHVRTQNGDVAQKAWGLFCRAWIRFCLLGGLKVILHGSLQLCTPSLPV